MARKYSYLTSCVHADGDDISEMVERAVEITLTELRNNCKTAIIEQHLGYGPDFPMSKDYHVRYFKSKYRGEPCFYIVHSATEYVFTKP